MTFSPQDFTAFPPTAVPHILASQKMTPKKKNPTASMVLAVGLEKIARLLIRNLDRQPPGARRHTRTAGTTITSLRGHLDVAIHKRREPSRKNYRCQMRTQGRGFNETK
jgi:hypothetical protein